MHCILHLWNRRVFCGKIDRRGAAASFQIKTVVGTRPHYIMAQTSYYLPLFTRFASRTIGIHGIRTVSERHQTGFSPTENLQISTKGLSLTLSVLASPDESCQDENNNLYMFLSLCFGWQRFDRNHFLHATWLGFVFRSVLAITTNAHFDRKLPLYW